jgi:hypothetical protein
MFSAARRHARVAAMGDSKDNRRLPGQPPSRAGTEQGARAPVPPAKASKLAATAARDKSAGTVPASKQDSRGRVVHDERGNAVWDWLKETGRIAIESTSRLLRKLEIPELKVEDKKDEALRLESDRGSGGGYDPYNQGTPAHKGGGRK